MSLTANTADVKIRSRKNIYEAKGVWSLSHVQLHWNNILQFIEEDDKASKCDYFPHYNYTVFVQILVYWDLY